MDFRIVSYNLLVPKFADQPHYYIRSDPRYLKTGYRWNLIKRQLEQQILYNANTIICFQELSETLLQRLKRFLTELHYRLFDCLYGGPNDDFMGVGIAIPNSIYVESVEKIHIGKNLQSYFIEEEKTTSCCCSKIWSSRKKSKHQSMIDAWQPATERKNRLLLTKLKINDRTVCVGTYHMPCAPQEPDLMLLHASYVKDLMFEKAHGRPFILAGDFNLSPTDGIYLYLVGQNPNAFDHLKKDFPFNYRPKNSQVLKSAYVQKRGIEPNYTNFAHTARFGVFCATLDYIFFSGDLIVEKILDLPSHPKGESYPDETNPSDHLMIAATFTF